MRKSLGIAVIAVSSIAVLATGCDRVPKGAVTSCDARIGVASVQTDILFVVDDSNSMAVEQANVAANFQAFIDQLAASPVKNDFQIGITTTSVDQNASGPMTPAGWKLDPHFLTGLPAPCDSNPNAGAPYPAGALVNVTATGLQVTSGGGRILSATSPTLVNDFVNNVNVGVCGSGKEQPLRAMQLALSDPLQSGANAGFLRPGARLAVVIVTDDDDCSDPGQADTNGTICGAGAQCAIVPSPTEGTNCEASAEAVGDFVDFLHGPIAGEMRNVLVAVIAGFDPTNLDPARCTVLNPDGSNAGTAEYQATRLQSFAAAFGPNHVSASICSQSFHDPLLSIADLLVPQTVTLDGNPADPRLLVVTIIHLDGSTVSCPVAQAGTADAATACAVYAVPAGGGQATLTFQGDYRLHGGDRLEIQIVCVR